MNDPTNKYLADFQNQIDELEALKAEGLNGWVVKLGSLWVHFHGVNYSNPLVTSAAGASVIRTAAEAYRVSKRLQNGNGDDAKVQPRAEAVDEQIAALKAVIEFLKSGKYAA